MKLYLVIVAIILFSSSEASSSVGVDEQHGHVLTSDEIELLTELHLRGTKDRSKKGGMVNQKNKQLSLSFNYAMNAQSSDRKPKANKSGKSKTAKSAKRSKANKFKPPHPDSSRGPCPAMNTLANHGYINRDGKAVGTHDVANGLETLFGVNQDEVLATFQGVIDRGLEHETRGNKTYFDLASLFNHEDGIESDASLFSVDFFFQMYAPPSLDLFQDLADYCHEQNLDTNTCTWQDLIDYQIVRMEDSCNNNPDAFNKWGGLNLVRSKTLDRSANFLLQTNPPENFALNETLDISGLKSFVIDNRLPKDFVTRYERGFEGLSFSDPDIFAATQSIAQQLCVALATLCPSSPQCSS